MSSCGYCFVPGCKSGYPSDRKSCKTEGRKVKSIFGAPKDPDLFAKWSIAIPRADRQLTEKSSVCELHFAEDDIERYYITNMPDGTVNKIEKGRCTLRKGAVPCIFPNLPAYFNRNAPKIKSSAKKQVKKQKTKPEIGTNEIQTKSELEQIQDDSTLDDSSDVLLPEDDQYLRPAFTFKCLAEHLHLVRLPDKWWGVTYTGEYVAWAKWTRDFNVERRVAVKRDLSTKVYLKESECAVFSNLVINSMEDVSSLLEKVQNLSLCAGIKQTSQSNCLLYLPERKGSERFLSFCDYCLKQLKRIS